MIGLMDSSPISPGDSCWSQSSQILLHINEPSHDRIKSSVKMTCTYQSSSSLDAQLLYDVNETNCFVIFSTFTTNEMRLLSPD